MLPKMASPYVAMIAPCSKQPLLRTVVTVKVKCNT